MNYSTSNYNTHSVRRYRPNFLTSMHKSRSYPRYLRQRTDHRMRSYGMAAGQRHRAQFLSRYAQEQQRRFQYPRFTNPATINARKQRHPVETVFNIINQFITRFSFIYRIVSHIQQKSALKLSSWGCSPGRCCGGITAASVMVVIGIGLGVGLGIELRDDGVFYNSTSNTTFTTTISTNIGR